MFLCWTWSATAVCRRVQKDRLFPTASFALSALSPYVSAGPWQWTAYLARTNHIWLLSVTVNYTPHGSCPDVTVQWKRSPHSAATRIFWRWARSQLASTTAFILSVICHFISIKKKEIGSAHLMLTIADWKVSKFWTKVKKKNKSGCPRPLIQCTVTLKENHSKPSSPLMWWVIERNVVILS